jgi:CheY-like chemotaxis protein
VIGTASRGASLLDEREARPERARSGVRATERRPRVLVVDREEFVRRRARRVLRRAGYHVLDTGDPSSALRLLEELGDDVDLLVLEGGAEVAARADVLPRAQRLRPGLRILLTWDRPARGPDAPPGGCPVLRKPFGPSQLLEAVARALSRPE